MRSRYTITDPEDIHFLTATIVEWLPVFTSHEWCDVIVRTLEFQRKEKGLRVYAYVILENHIHLVAQAPDLGRTMQQFKSFTARELIALAERLGRNWLLNQWAFYKQKHKRESAYQVWQEGMHPQLIQGETMLQQKMTYIHENPVRRGYVDAPEHWRYSSARNYVLGDHSVMRVDDVPGW